MGGRLNFYKRYPADYGKKTARLTLAQHGAYTLLLDEFYSTEKGLPGPVDELYRICRAMNKAEQEAVRVVADKHWPVAADGLRYNDRASEELIEATPALEAARANGKKGGRPKKETQQKPSGFPKDNPEGTQEEPSTKPPQSSDIPSSLRSEGKRTSGICRPDDVDEQTWGDWTALRKAKKASVTATVVDGARAEAGKAGLSLEEFLKVWCLRGSQGMQADWLKPHERGNTSQNTSIHDRRAATLAGLSNRGNYASDDRTFDAEARIVG